jgi:recombination protein RecT
MAQAPTFSGGSRPANTQAVAPMRPDQMLIKYKDQIGAALPKHINPDRMARIALTELRMNPTLARTAENNPASFFGAILKAAQLGLEPGAGLGQAYLIPYGNEVTMQIGYQGMIDIAMRSGKVEYIMSDVVYHNDDFQHEVTHDGIVFRHKKNYENTDMNETNIKLVYAMAKIKGGGTIIEVMTKDQVDRNEQKMRKGKKSIPWTDHWDQMARKTVVRRLYKSLPKSPEINDLTMHDREDEAPGTNMAQVAKDAGLLDKLPMGQQQGARSGASSGNELEDILADDTIDMTAETPQKQPAT